MVASWTYASSGGEEYPVQPGELWTAGPHYLACGDLEHGDALDLLRGLKITPDIIYTDPPWNAGNAASFRTKAGNSRRVDFMAFLVLLLEVASMAQRYAFIEMGRQNADLLAKLIDGCGGTVLARWPITYYRRHPCELLCATWTRQPAPTCNLTAMDDSMTPYAALREVGDCHKGELVFDPCTGRGLTARTAHGLGLDFVGMELSPWRMSAALHSLHKQGLKVARVGQFLHCDA